MPDAAAKFRYISNASSISKQTPFMIFRRSSDEINETNELMNFSHLSRASFFETPFPESVLVNSTIFGRRTIARVRTELMSAFEMAVVKRRFGDYIVQAHQVGMKVYVVKENKVHLDWMKRCVATLDLDKVSFSQASDLIISCIDRLLTEFRDQIDSCIKEIPELTR
jgi:hypothetical protein